jgi:hypothetical protein
MATISGIAFVITLRGYFYQGWSPLGPVIWALLCAFHTYRAVRGSSPEV